MFRDRAIFLFVISAILISLIFITRELILLGIFIVLFILSQVIFIYLFYTEEQTGLEQWYAFGSAIAGLVFILVLVLIGKKVFAEFLGLLLFLAYFIGLILFLFRQKVELALKKPEKKPIEEEDFEAFRKKDELQKLIESFELDTKPKAEIFDTEKPKRKEPVKEKKKEVPSATFFEYAEKIKEKPKIRELKEAPKIDFEKVKQDLEKIDTGVKTISEKIRMISEKAIKEGKKKKREEAKKKKKPKPKKKEMKVYASKTGTKYHYDKNCLGLKRVSKKNLVTYTNPTSARKKGLKSCGMCR